MLNDWYEYGEHSLHILPPCPVLRTTNSALFRSTGYRKHRSSKSAPASFQVKQERSRAPVKRFLRSINALLTKLSDQHLIPTFFFALRSKHQEPGTSDYLLRRVNMTTVVRLQPGITNGEQICLTSNYTDRNYLSIFYRLDMNRPYFART